MTDKPTDGNTVTLFDPQAISILQSIFNPVNQAAPAGSPASAASVKFMITLKDEEELRNLGYSQAQIDKIKPQEAAEILRAAKKAVQDEI